MASFVDRVRSVFRRQPIAEAAPAAVPAARPQAIVVAAQYDDPEAVRAAKASQAKGFGLASGGGRGVLEPRRGARTLRAFSESNPWVRIAINHRKRTISKAKWAIVRVDDPKAAPDPRIVKKATELFTFVNDTRTNLSWLLGEIVEDILVLDAGVFEKEKRHNGEIAALWPIDGSEIAPDPNWDGSEPNKPRYYQFRDGRLIAAYRNDELTYMMMNPRTNSAVGFSPLEALFNDVEADLYGAKLEYRELKQTVPAGLLYMGSGLSAELVESFRDQWDNEIAAQKGVAIMGGGDNAMDGQKPNPPQFIEFKKPDGKARREYIKWLVTKIAAGFEIDLLVFNLSETINKSVGNNLTAKTDTGLLALGDTVADFITREVIWELDPSHRHGFVFQELVPRDIKQELANQQAMMAMGATTPNEVRALHGLDPYPGSVGDPDHWANLPYPYQQQPITEKPTEDAIEETTEPDETNPDNEGEDDEDDDTK